MPHLPENTGWDAAALLLLWGLTPPFYFLLKDSRGHHLHRYHDDHVNSHSQESQQHPQSDLASSQQVQALNWKRKQSIFPRQDLQVMIKCLKNRQHADQFHCLCLCVLRLSFVFLSDPLLFRRKCGCPRTTGKCFEGQYVSWVLQGSQCAAALIFLHPSVALAVTSPPK